ncbi:MAG TPA: histidine kinase dimerization/phospho-acceptor domain-containing protein, partial [Cyclobacteriaceae bacterium]|nr:histidine kinase dimerization/phospho-acceptor domain-containing protein [Cyclobacteriaceae bacterium]
MEHKAPEINFNGELRRLAAFARFILQNHKDEFLEASLRSLRELKIPLLGHMTEEAGADVANASSLEMLSDFANNDPTAHIAKAIERWTKGQLPKAERNQIVVEDITLIAHSRKLTLLAFIPRFTNDPGEILALVTEIEKYVLQYTSSTFHMFVSIIDERIQDHIDSLRRRTHELQQSNASLEEFAFVASHDLNEPLRKISTFIDLLRTAEVTRSEKELSYLSRIHKGATRMRQMIDDLLSLSLISSNKSTEVQDLNSILADVLQTFEDKIERLNARVTSDKLPHAAIVPSQFRQLFQNLISNSLKFIRPGVPPSITISHRFLDAGICSMYDIK